VRSLLSRSSGGAASDALGRRAPLIVAGALGGAASYIALAAVPEFEFGFRAALAVRVVGGALTIGAFSLAITSLMDLRGGNGRNMGTAGVAIGLGAAVGSVVGGALADLNAFYPVYAGAAVLAGQGYSRLPSTTRSSPIGRPTRAAPRTTWASATCSLQARTTHGLFVPLAFGFVDRLTAGFFALVGVYYFQDPETFGLSAGGGGSDARALLRPLRGAAGPVRLAFRTVGRFLPVVLGSIAYGIVTIGVGVAPVYPVAAALMVLVGVCGALMAPATMALVTDLVEPEGPRRGDGTVQRVRLARVPRRLPHRRERHRSVRLHARVPRGRRGSNSPSRWRCSRP